MEPHPRAQLRLRPSCTNDTLGLQRPGLSHPASGPAVSVSSAGGVGDRSRYVPEKPSPLEPDVPGLGATLQVLHTDAFWVAVACLSEQRLGIVRGHQDQGSAAGQ